MKNVILLFTFLLPAVLFCQSDVFINKNALKISPFEFGKAEFQISYERYFGDRSSSITISPSFILKENSIETKEGIQIEAQYRIYLSHLRGENRNVFLGFHNIGLYTGLYARYLDYKEDYQLMWYDNMSGTAYTGDFTKEVSAPEGGALIGVQIDITNRILLDFFVGGGIRYSDISDSKVGVVPEDYFYEEYGVFDSEYKGVKPRIGFQIGVFF